MKKWQVYFLSFLVVKSEKSFALISICLFQQVFLKEDTHLN